MLHSFPWKPASHPVRHVPFVLEHWSKSRQWAHVSLQFIPYHPLPQSMYNVYVESKDQNLPWISVLLCLTIVMTIKRPVCYVNQYTIVTNTKNKMTLYIKSRACKYTLSNSYNDVVIVFTLQSLHYIHFCGFNLPENPQEIVFNQYWWNYSGNEEDRAFWILYLKLNQTWVSKVAYMVATEWL